MLNKDFVFTSESVTEGHPDKLADQISDTILDAVLERDKEARVAMETLVTAGLVFVSGELSTDSYVDIPKLARSVIKNVGYNDASIGFDWETCAVLTSIKEQSKDIALGINKQDMGAGDQGIMFGFATNETDVYMPLPIYYANSLSRGLAILRKSDKNTFLRPDGKTQVSVVYKDGKPYAISSIVVSTQHSESVKYDELKEFIIEELIYKQIPKNILLNTEFFINPTGVFIEGGPKADTGITGRKLIVDTYGGFSRHGGGAFSGKDPSKVDRSASYLARYIAKNLVASGVASRLEVQLAYAIGISEPLAIYVEDFGTGMLPKADIVELIKKVFPLKPREIIDSLGLLDFKYAPIASYGHFGRKDIELPWESLNKVTQIKEMIF